MSGVFFLGSEMKSCANCTNYCWKLPEDKASLQRCSRCKVIAYCSTQCQEEHWHNVHKQQCKYLAKQKVKSKSRHNKATCLVCKEVKMTGMVEMTKPGNPVLACPLADNNQGQRMINFISSTNLPFPLPEMTGQFHTKAEATITLMMRILLKMKLTEHPVWVINSKAAQELYDVLEEGRIRCWTVYRHIIPGPRLDFVVGIALQTFILNRIEDLTSTCFDLFSDDRFKDHEFKLWNTFMMLRSFLRMLNFDGCRNTAEQMGLPEISEDLMRTRVSSTQFNKIFQKILDKLNGGVVPFMALVEIICDGQLRQPCQGCLKEVTVSDVIVGLKRPSSDQEPTLLFGSISVSVCGQQACVQSTAHHVEEGRKLDMVYGKLAGQFGADMCDYCALYFKGVRGHRCSRCLTKVYCGEECRDQDWRIHKLVCRDGEVERKRKGGKQARKKGGSEIFENVKDKFECAMELLKLMKT